MVLPSIPSRPATQVIQDSTLRIIHKAKHACYLEHPDQWHQILTDFLLGLG
jgi:pimeloyl-ACP methyl ester carboxylesterase